MCCGVGMVKQVEKGACPLCRRELDWNTMVEYMRHVKANKLDIDGGKYGERTPGLCSIACAATLLSPHEQAH